MYASIYGNGAAEPFEGRVHVVLEEDLFVGRGVEARCRAGVLPQIDVPVAAPAPLRPNHTLRPVVVDLEEIPAPRTHHPHHQ